MGQSLDLDGVEERVHVLLERRQICALNKCKPMGYRTLSGLPTAPLPHELQKTPKMFTFHSGQTCPAFFWNPSTYLRI